MKHLFWTAGFLAVATPAAAAVTLFLVDPTSVTTMPTLTSPESFTESGPQTWNGAGLFDGVFSAADVEQDAATFGIATGPQFKVWTVTFSGSSNDGFGIMGEFPKGTVPIWAMNASGGGTGGLGGDGGTGGAGNGGIGGGGGGVIAAPEPSTWAMLISGFAFLAGLAWNRQRVHKLTTRA